MVAQCPRSHRANVTTEEFDDNGNEFYGDAEESDFTEQRYGGSSEYDGDYDYNYDQHSEHSNINCMVRVIETELDRILQMKAMDPSHINLDSYATRHMTPYFILEDQEEYKVPLIVGNNETLHSTHRGILHINKFVFRMCCLLLV